MERERLAKLTASLAAVQDAAKKAKDLEAALKTASGAIVQNGTDPPVEEIDPIASFHCSVTRELPDGSIFLPEQAMTREQALRSYTLNNAWAAFEEDVKGSLTKGKYADITVLTKDILTIPDDEIRSTEIAYTIIGGEVKFER